MEQAVLKSLPNYKNLSPKRVYIMFQVTFSEQSLNELRQLDMIGQMELLEPISNLTLAHLANPREPLGRFHRDGTVFYRLRANDYRIYFEMQKNETLYAHYILHRNSVADFLFRTKLPINEDQLVENHQSFWKYLETLNKDS